jgi:hypothetical protein
MVTPVLFSRRGTSELRRLGRTISTSEIICQQITSRGFFDENWDGSLVECHFECHRAAKV